MNTRNDFPVVAHHQSAGLPMNFAALPGDAYAQPGMSIDQLWTIAWAYRKVTMAIAGIIFAVTLAVVALMPRTYEATATLMVKYEINDPLNEKEFPIGLLGSYMATQTELLRSPEVLYAVIDKLNLTQNEDYTAGYRGDGSNLKEYVRNQLTKNLSVYQGQYASQLIYITYAADNAAHAALVANAVVDTFKDIDFKRSSAPVTDRAKRYAEQLDQLKVKVQDAQRNYTTFYQKNGLVDIGDRKGDGDVVFLSDLEQQLADAQRARRTAEARNSTDQRVGDSVLSSTLVQTLKTQLANQQAKLAEMRTTLGARHPDILQLQSQIDATRAQLDEEVSSYRQNASSGVSATRKLEEELQSAVKSQRGRVIDSNELHDQATKLRLELDSAQAVYKRALDGYDQVMFASTGNYTNIDVVNRATAPVRASKPRTMLLLLLGLMAGGALGLLAPLAYELMNRRVRCRDDLERDDGIPVLAEFQPLTSTGSPA